MSERETQRVSPMRRAIVAVCLTLVTFLLSADLGMGVVVAVGVVSGFWVLLGVGSAVASATTRASARPTKIEVGGTVAHVVVNADVAEQRRTTWWSAQGAHDSCRLPQEAAKPVVR